MFVSLTTFYGTISRDAVIYIFLYTLVVVVVVVCVHGEDAMRLNVFTILWADTGGLGAIEVLKLSRMKTRLEISSILVKYNG